jgi:hypothetical protein
VEHIRKLEVNRLIKELDYIKSDYNYKSELISEADYNFVKSVDTFLDGHPQIKQVFKEKTSPVDIPLVDFIDKEESVVIEESVNESSESEFEAEVEYNVADEIRDSKLKMLYRSIAKSTHPDKLKDESLKELYIEATIAYESGNILPLFTICDKLRIPYDVTEEETDLIKDEIKSIKDRVSFLESTFTWQWYVQTDENIRETVILSYIKSQLSR